MIYYPCRSTILQNFSTIAQTVYEICVTKFFTFWPLGANPWAKVHQKRRRPGGHRGLPSSKVSPPYVHPCRRYPLQKSCGQRNKQTKKQTVNDISTACLSACVDNKYASCPDWRISPQSLGLIFDTSMSPKVKFDYGNRKPVVPTHKCSLGSSVVSVTVFEIFRVKF